MGLFSDYYNNKRNRGVNPDDYTFVSSSGDPDDMVPINQMRKTVGVTPVEQPRIDTSNAIGSLAEMLGPTPAEREAQQNRLERGRQQMAMWTGLFDGLRQLSNLYYTAKGARPQQYSDPYKTVDENYNREVKRLDDLAQYQNLYGRQLYNLQRQAGLDEMQRESHQATLRWYNTRDEMARLKAENERLKTDQQVATQKARQQQIETKTKQMEELHPLQKKKLEAVINKYIHDAGKPYSVGGRGNTAGSDPFAELATLLNDNPDAIGPILQQEGLGYYNKDSKQFTFEKNATKGMATTAVNRVKQNQPPSGTSGRRNVPRGYKKSGTNSQPSGGRGSKGKGY